MKRIAFVLVVVGTALTWGALRDGAAAVDLEDYLRRAPQAEFTGRQLVVTRWGEESAAGVYQIAQSGGITKIDDGTEVAMMGQGTVEARTEQGLEQLQISEWSQWRLHERYTMGGTTLGMTLGRSATTVPIYELGVLRARIVFDETTGAALLSVIFDGEGDPFRLAMIMDFSPGSERMQLESRLETHDYSVIPEDQSLLLPAEAGGYWRADTYQGAEETIHAFYTDGLFSFSVFQFQGEVDPGPFDDAPRISTGAGSYRRLIYPGGVAVLWSSPDNSFVLVGDLPPDHLDRVLEDLPHPERASLVRRLWRRLFG